MKEEFDQLPEQEPEQTSEIQPEAPAETPQDPPFEAPQETPAESQPESPADVQLAQSAAPEEQKPGKKKKSPLKIVLISLLCVILAIVLIVGGYFAYVLIVSNIRLGNQQIEPQGSAAKTAVQTGVDYKFVSYNIGFGAYESDFGFFMDGGTEGRAWSEERLTANMQKITDLLGAEKADFYYVQEVDVDSTRSYHVDEREYLIKKLTGFAYTYAENWDSPYLFFPISAPHGSAETGIMTFSNFKINSAERFELPVETGFSKIVDLDRCYSKSAVSTENGKTLYLYNFHLSAYTSDPSTATEQLKILLADMDEEYGKGNYCIAGGDFNKDILGDSSKYFGISGADYNWAKPLPEGLLDEYKQTLIAPLNGVRPLGANDEKPYESKPVPSCRNADGEYNPQQFVITIDGFLVSPNVTVKSSNVIDTGFEYSDHNPVTMTFSLNS